MCIVDWYIKGLIHGRQGDDCGATHCKTPLVRVLEALDSVGIEKLLMIQCDLLVCKFHCNIAIMFYIDAMR